MVTGGLGNIVFPEKRIVRIIDAEFPSFLREVTANVGLLAVKY